MSATHHRNECMPIADDRNVYVHDDLFRGNLYGEHNNKPKYGVYCQLYGWPHVEWFGLRLSRRYNMGRDSINLQNKSHVRASKKTNR